MDWEANLATIIKCTDASLAQQFREFEDVTAEFTSFEEAPVANVHDSSSDNVATTYLRKTMAGDYRHRQQEQPRQQTPTYSRVSDPFTRRSRVTPTPTTFSEHFHRRQEQKRATTSRTKDNQQTHSRYPAEEESQVQDQVNEPPYRPAAPYQQMYTSPTYDMAQMMEQVRLSLKLEVDARAAIAERQLSALLQLCKATSEELDRLRVEVCANDRQLHTIDQVQSKIRQELTTQKDIGFHLQSMCGKDESWRMQAENQMLELRQMMAALREQGNSTQTVAQEKLSRSELLVQFNAAMEPIKAQLQANIQHQAQQIADVTRTTSSSSLLLDGITQKVNRGITDELNELRSDLSALKHHVTKMDIFQEGSRGEQPKDEPRRIQTENQMLELHQMVAALREQGNSTQAIAQEKLSRSELLVHFNAAMDPIKAQLQANIQHQAQQIADVTHTCSSSSLLLDGITQKVNQGITDELNELRSDFIALKRHIAKMDSVQDGGRGDQTTAMKTSLDELEKAFQSKQLESAKMMELEQKERKQGLDELRSDLSALKHEIAKKDMVQDGGRGDQNSAIKTSLEELEKAFQNKHLESAKMIEQEKKEVNQALDALRADLSALKHQVAKMDVQDGDRGDETRAMIISLEELTKSCQTKQLEFTKMIEHEQMERKQGLDTLSADLSALKHHVAKMKMVQDGGRGDQDSAMKTSLEELEKSCQTKRLDLAKRIEQEQKERKLAMDELSADLSGLKHQIAKMDVQDGGRGDQTKAIKISLEELAKSCQTKQPDLAKRIEQEQKERKLVLDELSADLSGLKYQVAKMDVIQDGGSDDETRATKTSLEELEKPCETKQLESTDMIEQEQEGRQLELNELHESLRNNRHQLEDQIHAPNPENRAEFSQHYNDEINCDNVLKQCPHCLRRQKMSELQEHIENCDCRLVSCPNDCGGKFLQRGIPNHLSTRCPKKPAASVSTPVSRVAIPEASEPSPLVRPSTAPTPTTAHTLMGKVECKFCDDEIDAKTIDDHEQNCDWKPKRCQHCNMVVISRDVQRHETSCKANLKSCPHCNENMPLYALSTHSSRCIKRPIKCIRCCQLFPADAIVGHSTICKFVPGIIPYANIPSSHQMGFQPAASMTPIKIPPPPPFPPPHSAATPMPGLQQNSQRATGDPHIGVASPANTTVERTSSDRLARRNLALSQLTNRGANALINIMEDERNADASSLSMHSSDKLIIRHGHNEDEHEDDNEYDDEDEEDQLTLAQVVKEWSVENVCLWLHEDVGVPNVVLRFQQMQCNGEMLLELTESDLINDFGIGDRGQRERILSAIEAINTSNAFSDEDEEGEHDDNLEESEENGALDSAGTPTSSTMRHSFGGATFSHPRDILRRKSQPSPKRILGGELPSSNDMFRRINSALENPKR